MNVPLSCCLLYGMTSTLDPPILEFEPECLKVNPVVFFFCGEKSCDPQSPVTAWCVRATRVCYAHTFHYCDDEASAYALFHATSRRATDVVGTLSFVLTLAFIRSWPDPRCSFTAATRA